jgi:hypothetical protein
MHFQINSMQHTISITFLIFLMISFRTRIMWFSDLCIVANLHQNETYKCEIRVHFAPLHWSSSSNTQLFLAPRLTYLFIYLTFYLFVYGSFNNAIDSPGYTDIVARLNAITRTFVRDCWEKPRQIWVRIASLRAQSYDQDFGTVSASKPLQLWIMVTSDAFYSTLHVFSMYRYCCCYLNFYFWHTDMLTLRSGFAFKQGMEKCIPLCLTETWYHETGVGLDVYRRF